MLPRQVMPGQFYLITRRCTQRQFLLRPDPATNNAFLYCLIHAAQRSEVDVLLPCAMSNHYHVVIYDRAGRYPELIEHFHKLLARSQNALRGRWENFWSSEQTCVVRLADRLWRRDSRDPVAAGSGATTAVAADAAEAAGNGSTSLGGLTLVGSHARGRQNVGRGIRRASPTVGVREPTSGRAQVDGARSAARALATC